jgi:hypothetical protein
MMFAKVKKVTPLDNYWLKVEFLGGTVKTYDINPLFSRWPAFSSLKSIPGLYGQVKVDTGGYGISWNDEVDLAASELWEHGV